MSKKLGCCFIIHYVLGTLACFCLLVVLLQFCYGLYLSPFSPFVSLFSDGCLFPSPYCSGIAVLFYDVQLYSLPLFILSSRFRQCRKITLVFP